MRERDSREMLVVLPKKVKTTRLKMRTKKKARLSLKPGPLRQKTYVTLHGPLRVNLRGMRVVISKAVTLNHW